VKGADSIGKALGGHRSGGGWVCKCVAHDDKEPSLSIKDGHDQILVKCHAGCDPRDIIAELQRRGLWPEREKTRDYSARPKPERAARPEPPPQETSMAKVATRIWRECVSPWRTWVEDYLASRGLKLPRNVEIARNIRFHPKCPMGDDVFAPAMVCAFEKIEQGVPAEPYLDHPPFAIHRIRGPGHANKKMLGPTAGQAVMLSPWWHVYDVLHICEGIETGRAIMGEHREDPEDRRRPVWALGTAGAMERFPNIARVQKLYIWADRDKSTTGTDAADACRWTWHKAGKQAVIMKPPPEAMGKDWLDLLTQPETDE
jgi:putative DNA primase/helicase